jgi:hypothetical protein
LAAGSTPKHRKSRKNSARSLFVNLQIAKFITAGERILKTVTRTGWYPGARYTNLRTVKTFNRIGFLDIELRRYDFRRHIAAAEKAKPILTVARDILDLRALDSIINEVKQLQNYAEYIIMVPKGPKFCRRVARYLPEGVILGYSVPTRYGGTDVPVTEFVRPVHVLGGSPSLQRRLGDELDVVSIDCNRFMIDALYGKYFDGRRSVRHPHQGRFFDKCITASLEALNDVWRGYRPNSIHLAEKIVESCREIRLIR